jgi:hypothetical protein
MGWYQKLSLDPNEDFQWPGGNGEVGGVARVLASYQGLIRDGVYTWECTK